MNPNKQNAPAYEALVDRLIDAVAEDAFGGREDQSPDTKAARAELLAALSSPPAAGDAVQAEVVGKVRPRRGVHGDFDGFEVEWLLEGGIHAVGLDGDAFLYVLDIPAPEDGHVELFAAPKPAAPPSVTDADTVVTAMVEAHPAFREWWNELPETTAQSFMDRLAPVLAPRAQPEVKPSSDEIRDHPLSKFAVPPTESHAVQSAPVDWNPGLWGGK